MKTFVVSVSIAVFALGALLVIKFGLPMGHASSDSMAMAQPSTSPKQLYTCGMHPQVIQDHPGNCPICHMKMTPLKNDSDSSDGVAKGKRRVLYYWDPMLGPSSIAHAPGKSAMGMELVPVFEDDASGGPSVRIDPSIVQNMGVRTALVTRGPLQVTVRAVGMLEVPEPSTSEVNLRISGWIEKLYANTEGMHIHKGEPLFDLYSPDIQVAEEELIGAVKAMGNSTSKSSPAPESKNLVESAKQKLKLFGIADQDIDAISKSSKPPQTVSFRSPADGDLVEKMVVEGSAVQAGVKLMRIEDHSKLWLNAEVYEDQISSVSLGQTVEATVDGDPGKVITGPIMFIYPHVDHMTRTVTVRIAIDNPDHKFRPGMFAIANIITTPILDDVLVPRESVIDTGTRQIVFVAEADGHFDPRKVRMGITGNDDQVEILEGLAPGETVVTSGQFLMDVESRTTEAIEKLRSSTPAAPSMAATEPMTAMSEQTSEPTSLVKVHCPMKEADWLQVGTVIKNPYLGTSMQTCGAITKTVSSPMEGTEIDSLTDKYLAVSTALSSDTFDADAIQKLSTAGGKLSGDSFSPLKQSIEKLSGEKDIEAARTAFESVSDELFRVLDRPAK
jgi:RND family efflux transporter MFP subunit